MRVLLTGGSSFTGYWFARALHQAGHEVVAPLKRSLDIYDSMGGARAERVKLLAGVAQIIPDCAMGSDAFLALCERKKFDVFCHHAAVVGDYKSANFDMEAAVAENTYRLHEVLSALKAGGARAMVLTGSVFEAGMGAGTEPVVAFSPYAESKTRTAIVAAELCASQNIHFARFIIPNVFGPLQEPRFYDVVLRQWAAGETAIITAPDLVRDHVPVDLLALSYAQFIEQSLNESCATSLPSCYAEDMHKFTERMAKEMRARTALPCDYSCEAKLPYNEPLARINTQRIDAESFKWDKKASWDALAAWYFPHETLVKRG